MNVNFQIETFGEVAQQFVFISFGFTFVNEVRHGTGQSQDVDFPFMKDLKKIVNRV
jgi:hypothetical protein